MKWDSPTIGNGDLWFGGAANGEYFDGLVDEVRIANVTRSDNWIWACYMTMGSNPSFTTYGVVQTSRPKTSASPRVNMTRQY